MSQPTNRPHLSTHVLVFVSVAVLTLAAEVAVDEIARWALALGLESALLLVLVDLARALRRGRRVRLAVLVATPAALLAAGLGWQLIWCASHGQLHKVAAFAAGVAFTALMWALGLKADRAADPDRSW